MKKPWVMITFTEDLKGVAGVLIGADTDTQEMVLKGIVEKWESQKNESLAKILFSEVGGA